MNAAAERYAASAIAWALARVGERTYPKRCLAFVEDAYERANDIEVFGGASARESAELYGFNPYDPAAPPPAGSFVFYRCSGVEDGTPVDWGHVGMALGDGRVVHAWDAIRVDDARAVEELAPATGWGHAELLGWTPVERILRDHRGRAWADA